MSCSEAAVSWIASAKRWACDAPKCSAGCREADDFERRAGAQRNAADRTRTPTGISSATGWMRAPCGIFAAPVFHAKIPERVPKLKIVQRGQDRELGAEHVGQHLAQEPGDGKEARPKVGHGNLLVVGAFLLQHVAQHGR